MAKSILFIALMICLISSAYGSNAYNDTTDDHQWMTSGNWDKLHPPTTDDQVALRATATAGTRLCQIQVGENAVGGYAEESGSPSDPGLGVFRLEVYGTLTNYDATGAGNGLVVMGWTNPYEVLIDGGLRDMGGINIRRNTVTIDIVNGGILDTVHSDPDPGNVYHGVLAITPRFSYPGYMEDLNILDGAVYTDHVEDWGKLASFPEVDINIGCAGHLYVADSDGSEKTYLEYLAGNGYLQSVDPLCPELVIEWDGSVTHAYCIPEPATISLFGLGGLLLRRRKK